ncbi:Ig-like domain-containing protein, partial [Pseudomonas sp. F1_0610]|uniref:Ig-like domain-containing protein n=1 Tax=Pseudomonas sp. F1_0610 TaxID=3114284 RepID=UPI0039C2B192
GDKGITNDTTPTLKGSLSQALGAGEYLAIYRNGSEIARLSEAQLNGSLTWSFEDSGLTDATYTYTARVKDAAGNNGAISNNYEITVDTQVPDQTVRILNVFDDQAPVTGNVAHGGYTDDKTPTLTGSISAALKAGEVLAIYLGNVRVGQAQVNADLTWTYTGLLNSDGAYTFTAAVENTTGSKGQLSNEYSINLDTTTPSTKVSINGYIDNVGDVTGEMPSGSTTDDRNPVLFGKITAGLTTRESILIFDTTRGAIGSGNEVLVGTAVVDGDKWTYKIPESHRLENNTTPKFTAVISNGSTYGNASAELSLKVDLEIKVNNINTLDKNPIISGSVGFKIYQDEYVEVTINGKTYNSKTGDVVVDPLNNTWYVKLPASNTLSAGTKYDVVAKLIRDSGTLVVKDTTYNEVNVGKNPVAPVIPDSNDPANKATGITIGEDGLWRVFSNMNVLNQTATDITNTSSFSSNTLNSNGRKGVYGSMSFVDFNRNGYMDIVGLDSQYVDGQQAFEYRPNAGTVGSNDGISNKDYYAFIIGKTNGSGGVNYSSDANVYSWWGGTALYDKVGDGYVDIIYGDRTPNDANVGGGYNTQFVLNKGGIFSKDPTFVDSTANSVDKDPDYQKYGQTNQATPHKLVSTVDLNNDGAVDVVFNGTFGSNYIGSKNSGTSRSTVNGRLVIASNKGTGALEVTQILTGVGNINGIAGYSDTDGFNGQSLVWADFNGDGYLDLFLGSVGSTYNSTNNSSYVFYNDNGKLSQVEAIGTVGTAKTYTEIATNKNVGGAISVDWNMDGKADVITIPRLSYQGRPMSTTQEVKLLTNQFGVAFQETILASSQVVTSAAGAGKGYSGLVNIDLDWDGRQDLLVFTGNAGTTFIENKNTLKKGTALHLKILDQEGINALFGNTVHLYDSKGNLVGTQVLNHQAGNQTSNSTALLSFYGLDPKETYNAVLLRNIGGVEQHVGASSFVGQYNIANVNAAWGGLKTGENWDAYVLTAESGKAVNDASIGNGVVGTGYNDTFFATLGVNKYEGGGGSKLVNGVREWSNTGGLDIIDFKLAGKTNITVDLRLSNFQDTGFGVHQYSNIEGVRGGAGNDTFYSNSKDNFFDGGAGNNTFHLKAGGQDTIMYKLLSNNSSGGHGTDIINDFWVGTVEATANADIINIKELLVGYTGKSYLETAKYVNGKATLLDDSITKYLRLEDGVLYLDRDGAGGSFNEVKLADINFQNVTNDQVDLATLLANHQIVF